MKIKENLSHTINEMNYFTVIREENQNGQMQKMMKSAAMWTWSRGRVKLSQYQTRRTIQFVFDHKYDKNFVFSKNRIIIYTRIEIEKNLKSIHLFMYSLHELNFFSV